jgi:DNA-binding CsgD family transcriptional regulator
MRAIWRRKRAPGLGGPRRRATDVDEIAVERAVAGERLTLTLRERGLAIDRLTRAGLSARQIGLRLGISDRTVGRYRAGQIQAAQSMPERNAA